MSLTAAHLDALILSGATAEQIVALVKADMAELEANPIMRRVKDAERQRRRRSRDVTQCHVDTDGQDVTPPSPLSPPKKDPEPQKITPPISPIPDYLRGRNLPEGLP